MSGRRIGFVASVAALLCLANAALATTDPTIPTIAAPPVVPPPGAPPRAYVVVDAATGIVTAASNDRQPLPPASMSKILTALAAVAALKPTDRVPVSPRAAGMPAHKLNMKAGENWPVGDTLEALLQSSANDAGAALAERISGTLENFKTALSQLAASLHLADFPVLQDPSGLDDNFSVHGGNLISARDLAIAARALLAEPRLAPIVAAPVARFTDPGGVPHRLINHNKLLTRYFGAVGMKTGFTKKSGRGLVAAATRNGRTEIVVVMNVADTYGWAAALLDRAFAAPVPTAGDRLPAVPKGFKIKALGANSPSAVTTVPPLGVVVTPTTSAVVDDELTKSTTGDLTTVKLPAADDGLPLAAVLALGGLGTLALLVAVLRARVLVKRRRRRRRRSTSPNASVRHHPNRRRHPRLTPHYLPQEDLRERFHDVTRG